MMRPCRWRWEIMGMPEYFPHREGASLVRKALHLADYDK